MKEEEKKEKLISADMDGLLKGDSEPGQQRVTELQWKHNGNSPSPNASHLPSLGFSSHCRPCQATTWARLVQQSRNKTTLINANWGRKENNKQLTLSNFTLN